MIDWSTVIANDFAFPQHADTAVNELTTMLASADPVVRDEWAYGVLTTWIKRGMLDRRLAALGSTMVERLGHPEVQARTFAPLILAAASLGWLHAVAHGADLAGAFGSSPRLSGLESAQLLTLVAQRVVAPTSYQYAHMEEDRITYLNKASRRLFGFLAAPISVMARLRIATT